MRYRELQEGVWDTVAPRYDSKPAYMIPMEDSEDGEEYPVWVNPSRNTFQKIIGYRHETRAIIAHDGTLYVWDQPNLYHSDVTWKLHSLLHDFVTLTCGSDFVAVKGEHAEPVEYTDPKWLPVLQKTFARYYPGGVKFEEYNWF